MQRAFWTAALPIHELGPYSRPMDLDAPNTLLITCAPGLSKYLAEELRGLGHTPTDVRDTNVEMLGSLRTAMALNLQLRTAYNVLYLLREFRAASADALYQAVYEVPWEALIEPDGYVCVTSHVHTPSINHWSFASLKTKDAIVDRMSDRCGRRPDAGPERDRMVVHLLWHDDYAWLYWNTSGRKLSDRNYRKIPFSAPVQESLAAAILMEGGYDGSQPLVAPMCGSGTFAIEAALWARGRPPGDLRTNFGLQHQRGFDDAAWRALRHEVKQRTEKREVPAIIASDNDPAAVEAARQNARTAGVEQLIEFHVCDFAETPMPATPGGLVVLNPAYGLRLDAPDDLRDTYARIGDYFKQRCAGHTGLLFTGNLDLIPHVGLRPSRRTVLYNGNIECRLLRYELYSGTRRKDKTSVSAPTLADEPPVPPDAEDQHGASPHPGVRDG